MKLDDVMTTQEAGERWKVPADSIKQCCLKRYAIKQFTDNEARKSGRNWLVTRQGMERLYGEEPKMLKVFDTSLHTPKLIAEVENYKDAWTAIVTEDFKGSPCVGEYTLEDWLSDDFEDLREEYPEFKPTDKMKYIYLTEYGNGPIVEPETYDKESVNTLLSHLRMSYRIDEE